MSNNPNNFYVIPQLRLCDGELLCKPNGKRALREVHFQQGTLDGACGVYSFLMALGILGVFEPRNITVDRMKDLPAKEQGFVRELHKHGLYRKGLYGEEIKGLLESHYRSRIQVDYVEKENKTEEFLQTVLDSLVVGSPCILGISNRRRKLGHWVLAVGYQYDSDTELLGFLILDPGVSSPKMMLWNGMLNLISDGSKCEYLTIDSRPEDILTVEIEDAVIISRKSKTKK